MAAKKGRKKKQRKKYNENEEKRRKEKNGKQIGRRCGVGGIKAAVYSRRSFSSGASLWKIEIINRVSGYLFPLFRFLPLPPSLPPPLSRPHPAVIVAAMNRINQPTENRGFLPSLNMHKVQPPRY